MFGEAGNYDGIQFVFKEMREVGIKPKIFVHNALLGALGKTGKPGLTRNLFEEMVDQGVDPNARTLTALAKIYGRARWGRDALQLWDKMRELKMPADNIICNTLLSMCADVGLVAEAEQLFNEMKDPECRDVPKPDKWSYTAMINIYGSNGDTDRALQLFAEMLNGGIEPNIMSVPSASLPPSPSVPNADALQDPRWEETPVGLAAGCLGRFIHRNTRFKIANRIIKW